MQLRGIAFAGFTAAATAAAVATERIHLGGKSASQYFLDDGISPLSYGKPWAKLTARTATKANVPNTGVTCTYDWTITRTTFAPDGVERTALLVNGQFPGPTLEANYGDTFQITINNQIPDEGTLLHWHGLLHQGSPWYDGVPAVDSCPIAPNTSFIYTFQADQYGTSWWHSHYSAQLADGLWGPMIIYGPESVKYDYDLGPVSMSAHYHQEYHYYIDSILAVPGGVPFSNNNLINGKGTYNCSLVTGGQPCTPNTPISTFNFQTGKTYLIRLINSGAEGTQHFTIDGHTMTIVANDYVQVQPYSATFVTLAVGQRTDVLVTANANPSESYYMRANMSGICDPALGPDAVAAVYYPQSVNKQPTSTPIAYNVNTCTNDPLSSTVPIQVQTPPSSPATTKTIDITLGTNSSGNQLFFMNGESFCGDYNLPVEPLAGFGDTYFEPKWNIYNFGSNSSIRIIINNMTPLYHPMHLHGHNFWVLAEGVGTWNGAVTNPSNPQRRDVQNLSPGTEAAPGYIVIEWVANNPGIWPLHCHISWHIASGLYVGILEQPQQLKQYSLPSSIVQTCRNWWQFTGHDVVDQIDSGL